MNCIFCRMDNKRTVKGDYLMDGYSLCAKHLKMYSDGRYNDEDE